jgi:multidrug efflux system membrane fusion protein
VAPKSPVLRSIVWLAILIILLAGAWFIWPRAQLWANAVQSELTSSRAYLSRLGGTIAEDGQLVWAHAVQPEVDWSRSALSQTGDAIAEDGRLVWIHAVQPEVDWSRSAFSNATDTITADGRLALNSIDAEAYALLATDHHKQRHKSAVSQADSPIPVLATTAHAGDIPISLDALGTVTPLAMVTVKSQLSGYLTEVAFTEGQTVNRGDFLAEIDPRPYQAALEQAQGQLARDQALLENANTDLKRFRTLLKQDSIAGQQVDTQKSLVQQLQGTLLSDQAQVDTAKLNLAYCHITAPITGQIGLRHIDQGNYVQAADPAGLAAITQMHPISIVFSIPEDDIPMVQRRLRDGAKLTVIAYDRTQSAKLATGTLSTIDNEIDPTTGMIRLRAQFDNNDDSLFPNQFVNTTLLVDVEHNDTIVPMAAIQHGANGDYVFLVKPDDTVTLQAVQLGSSSGDNVDVRTGLKPGDQVVVDGVDRLREGSKVAVTGLPAHPANLNGATNGDQADGEMSDNISQQAGGNASN